MKTARAKRAKDDWEAIRGVLAAQRVIAARLEKRELHEDIEALLIEVDRKGQYMRECNLKLMDAERVYGEAMRRLEALRRQSETEGDANGR